MAKLPDSVSLQAIDIQSALREGRTEDARTAVVVLLRAGKADRVVQAIAADLLKPVKRPRGRQKSAPDHWYEIAKTFENKRDDGVKYEDAIRETAERFGYSERHVMTALRYAEPVEQD